MIIYILFILFSLFNIITSIRLNVNKNVNKNNSSLKIRILNNINKNNNYSSVELPLLLKPELGLYSIDIYIGEPKQKFSLVIDSGSSILWVYDNKCKSCKSKNKFTSSNSKAFMSNKETINLNYVTGKLKGELCQDNLNFNDKFNMPLFYFVLIYESNLDFEMDGIIGLSKGVSYRKRYSFMNQIYEKKLIKENYVIYDLFNKYFYISEMPSYLEKQKKISCYDNDEFSTFWKCDLSSMVIDNVPVYLNNKIIFDSGTNGIVFPIKYLDIFKNIISNNNFLSKNKCKLVNVDNDNIYKLECDQIINTKNINSTYNFIQFYFDKNTLNDNNNYNNTVGFKLIDLLEEGEQAFSLYIFDRKDEILLGAPFFEKYPIMFNKDENLVTIFGEGNNIYRNNSSYINKINIFFMIIVICLIIFVILLIIRERIFSKFRINYSQIENLTEEN